MQTTAYDSILRGVKIFNKNIQDRFIYSVCLVFWPVHRCWHARPLHLDECRSFDILSSNSRITFSSRWRQPWLKERLASLGGCIYIPHPPTFFILTSYEIWHSSFVSHVDTTDNDWKGVPEALRTLRIRVLFCRQSGWHPSPTDDHSHLFS
jgi:hypothetical protein